MNRIARLEIAAVSLAGVLVLASVAAAASRPAFTGPVEDPAGLDDVGTRSRPALADLDGDGDLDVVVGRDAASMAYFENTGTATAPSFSGPTTNPFGLPDIGAGARPTFVDLDGDGDLDAIVGDPTGSLFLSENTGSASAPVFAEAVENPLGLEAVGDDASPAFADLDGDGDLDALIGESDGDLRYFENIGNAVAPLFDDPVTNPFGLSDSGPGPSLALVDLDDDGDADLLVGAASGALFSRRNVGSAVAPAFAAPVEAPFGLTDVGSHAAPSFGDLDGDGDPEALVGEDSGSLFLFENEAVAPASFFTGPTQNAFGLVSVGTEGFTRAALGDLDADGDLDVLVGEGNGSTYLFENEGTAVAPAFAAPVQNPFGLSDIGFYASPSLADLDGDGDLDALLGSDAGPTFYFENTGSATAPVFAPSGTNPFGLISVSSRSKPSFADLDGDGDLDALLGDSTGRLYHFENTGSATAPSFALPSVNPFGLGDVGDESVPFFEDADGDGDLDAFVGARSGSTYVFENTGSATSPSFAGPTVNPLGLVDTGSRSSPAFADVDGDGDLDLLSGAANRTTFYYERETELFGDDFELGDTSRWSETLPEIP